MVDTQLIHPPRKIKSTPNNKIHADSAQLTGTEYCNESFPLTLIWQDLKYSITCKKMKLKDRKN